MKHVMRRPVLSVVLVAVPVIVSGQSLDVTGTRRANPSEAIGVTPSPDSANRGFSGRDLGAVPGFRVPPRSPDLGSPASPLSPSIGPGSGLLGPESGRNPSQRRSNAKRRDKEENGRGGR